MIGYAELIRIMRALEAIPLTLKDIANRLGRIEESISPDGSVADALHSINEDTFRANDCLERLADRAEELRNE